MDSARHVIGCHLTNTTRVRNALDDVASTIHQSLNSVSGLVWYRWYGTDSCSTNQNCPFRESHRPTRRRSDRVAILE